MKKISLILVAVIAGISLLFASCGSIEIEKSTDSDKTILTTESDGAKKGSHEESGEKDTNTSITTEEETNGQEKSIIAPGFSVKYEPSVGLEFTSNGDGTCSITGIGSFNSETLVIPESAPYGETVSSVDEYALYKCEAKKLVISGLSIKIKGSGLSTCDFEEIIIDSSNVEFDDSSASYCDDVTSLTINNSTVSFGEYSFYKVGDDAVVSFENSKIKANSSAFSTCSFKSLSMNNCEITAKESAFSYIDDVETIEMHSCNLDLGEYAFYKCGSNMSLLFENSNGEIGDSCFSTNEATSITIDGCELDIGVSAFAYSKKLLSFSVGKGTYSFDDYALYKCEKLTKVILGDGSSDNEFEFGDGVFSSCKKLEKVDIGSGTIELGDNCFAYCDSLSEVAINDDARVESGSYVFYKCADNLVIKYNGQYYNSNNFGDF